MVFARITFITPNGRRIANVRILRETPTRLTAIRVTSEGDIADPREVILAAKSDISRRVDLTLDFHYGRLVEAE